MDELLKFYEHELSLFRNYARGFAERYPKTAGALHVGGALSEDPHVERLVQSFALLAARIRMQLDDDYAKFSESFLESLYPHFLRPLPSHSIAQLSPGAGSSGDSTSATLARGTVLQSQPVNGVLCQFSTIYDVALLPLVIKSASFIPIFSPPPALTLPRPGSAAISIAIDSLTGAFNLAAAAPQRLRIFVEGEASFRAQLLDRAGDRIAEGTVNSEEQSVILSNHFEMHDLPDMPLSRASFSKFALTFDPLREPFSELERLQFEEKKPQSHHTVRVLRAYLYSWQRIWNNKTYDMPASFLFEVQTVVGWIGQRLK